MEKQTEMQRKQLFGSPPDLKRAGFRVEGVRIRVRGWWSPAMSSQASFLFQ